MHQSMVFTTKHVIYQVKESMTSCASVEGSKVSWLLKGVLLFIFFESVCFVISSCPVDVRSAARISASATERCFLCCGLA